ncbi:MAG: type II secretion system protein [Clostridia bacterium]|nr:type II secretion system protein [Clostridia bacterium]
MKALKNKKGMTLVEMIIGIMLLAIAGIMLAQSFASCANIINRATLYRNASDATSSSIELQEEQGSKDANVSVDLRTDTSVKTIRIVGKKKNGTTINKTVNGELIVGSDTGKSSLTYREFLPGTFDFVINAEETGD